MRGACGCCATALRSMTTSGRDYTSCWPDRQTIGAGTDRPVFSHRHRSRRDRARRLGEFVRPEIPSYRPPLGARHPTDAATPVTPEATCLALLDWNAPRHG